MKYAKNITVVLLVFFLPCWATLAIANQAPEIIKFQVIQKEQGEEGELQTIVRGVAKDAEDKSALIYQYKVISGSGSLKPIKRYALFKKNKDSDKLTFELTVTDSEGLTAKKQIEYQVINVAPERLYTDERLWNKAIGKTYAKHASFGYQKRNEQLPNALIIGNSISIGYTSFVQDILKGICNVNRIPENGGPTQKGVALIDFWLGDRDWDVIHFNFGMHDFKRLVNNKLDVTGDRYTSEQDYRKNLHTIIKKLKLTKAKLIWANISIVPEGAEGRIVGEEVLYNKIAHEVVTSYGDIKIDDQYRLTTRYPLEQRENNVHFWDEGKQRQAKQVAKLILQAL